MGTVTVDFNADFAQYDYIMVDEEIMKVSSTSGDTDLTVTRGQLSTTAVSHIDKAAVKLLSAPTTTVTASATAITVPFGTAYLFTEQSTIKIDTEELVITAVTSDASTTTDTLTVTRGTSGTTPATIYAPGANGKPIQLVGLAVTRAARGTMAKSHTDDSAILVYDGANQLTVARGDKGSTKATHQAGASIKTLPTDGFTNDELLSYIWLESVKGTGAGKVTFNMDKPPKL